MTFKTYYEDGGSSSAYYILAEGVITPDTPTQFAIFAKSVKAQPVVYFNSLGGNLAAGIQLGRKIRELALDTYVGGEYISYNSLGKYQTLVNQSVCFSACAYAFLGGTSRKVATNQAFGVHQFFSGNGDAGESSAQVGVTVLANYLDEMGVDRKLLDVASLTASSKIQLISTQIAQTLNIDNTNPPLGEWKIQTDKEGELSAVLRQKQPGKNAVFTIILSHFKDSFAMVVFYDIKQKFRSQKELINIFQHNEAIPEMCATSLNDDDYCKISYPFANVRNWEYYNGLVFMLLFQLPIDTVLKMTESASIDFDANFANAYSDVDPSTTFSTKNLRSVVMALSKQR